MTGKNGGKHSVGGKRSVGKTKGSTKKKISSQSMSNSSNLSEQELDFIRSENPDSNETALTLTQEAKLQGSLKRKRQKRNETEYGRDFSFKVKNPLVDHVEVNYSQNRVTKADSYKKNANVQKLVEKYGVEEFERRTHLKKDNKDYIPKTYYDYYVNYVLDQDQKHIVKEYEKEEKIPLLIPIKAKNTSRASDDLIDLTELDLLPEVTKAVEKPLNTDKSSKISLAGQNLQASIDDDLRFKGLYFQDGSQTDPLLHLAKFQYIDLRSDQDDTANYSAYFLNYYIYNDPLKKNVDFNKRDAEGNIIDSSAYRRNKAIEDAIKFSIGSSLTYRDTTGENRDVTISDQKLAICNYLYSKEADIDVVTPDQTVIFENFKAKDLPDDEKPVLKFDWKNKKFHPLNSDTLLRVAVKEFNLEPDSVQAILEALYHADWINYPRADQLKALDEPIYVKVGPNFDGRKIEDYQGTVQEKEILNLIYQAEASNYVKEGDWNLYYGDKIIATTPGYVLGDNPQEYTDDAFDIQVNRSGKTPQQLTDFLTRNNINTPATRTLQLTELKQAGIITVSNGVYNLDKRGIALKSAYDFVTKHSFNAVDLKNEIDQVPTSQGVKGFKKVLSKIKPLNRQETAQQISHNTLELIEQNNDLANLEEF